jgi:hypothetical protein
MWKYLIAIVLVAHGVGQILPFLAAWTTMSVFSDVSWLFSAGVGISTPIGQAFAPLGRAVGGGMGPHRRRESPGGLGRLGPALTLL